jgi:peptidylprolyl isomerase
MTKVKSGDFVQLHYIGSLEDGTIFDSSEGRNPLEFQAGSGAVISGFDNAVMDMEINEEKKFSLTPEEAYGPRREDMQRELPREMLGDMQVEIGQELRFSTPRGPVSGTVLSVDEDKFLVDFNHPLAGKTLEFTIKLVGITDHPTQAGCSCSSASSASSCGSGCSC